MIESTVAIARQAGRAGGTAMVIISRKRMKTFMVVEAGEIPPRDSTAASYIEVLPDRALGRSKSQP